MLKYSHHLKPKMNPFVMQVDPHVNSQKYGPQLRIVAETFSNPKTLKLYPSIILKLSLFQAARSKSQPCSKFLIQTFHSGDHRCSRDKPRPDRGHHQESRGQGDFFWVAQLQCNLTHVKKILRFLISVPKIDPKL